MFELIACFGRMEWNQFSCILLHSRALTKSIKFSTSPKFRPRHYAVIWYMVETKLSREFLNLKSQLAAINTTIDAITIGFAAGTSSRSKGCTLFWQYVCDKPRPPRTNPPLQVWTTQELEVALSKYRKLKKETVKEYKDNIKKGEKPKGSWQSQ